MQYYIDLTYIIPLNVNEEMNLYKYQAWETAWCISVHSISDYAELPRVFLVHTDPCQGGKN